MSAFAAARRIPLVIGTTGQTPEDLSAIREASEKVPVLIAGNMSLGIATLVELVKVAVRMFPDADVEIIEKHHNQKLDVPSGTALMLADAVKSVRGDSVFLVGGTGTASAQRRNPSTLRMGVVASTGDNLHRGRPSRLTHRAQPRPFAEGALAAARFIADKPPGFYAIQECEQNKKGLSQSGSPFLFKTTYEIAVCLIPVYNLPPVVYIVPAQVVMF